MSPRSSDAINQSVRYSDPLTERGGWVGRGAVLYDVRDATHRTCCAKDRERHLYHITSIYEEIETGEVLVEVQDGTHTVRETIHLDDVLAFFEPAGFTISTGTKPTYILTRQHGIKDGHDLMTDGGRSSDGTEQREGFVYRKGGKKLSAFPYPGGKTSYVNEIVRRFPEHRRYVTPFGGSAAVLLNKPPSYIEVFNDLNSDIVHFFEVVRERKEKLQKWLRRTPFSRELHERWGRAFYQGERPDDDLERAGRWYYLRYTQYGGKVDRFSGFKTSIKRNEARSLRGATEHLDEVVTRLQDVILENQDYRKVVNRYDRPDTLFYFDPPYFETTYNYYGTGEFNHQRLADVLAEIEGYWICSYGDLPPSLKAQIIGNRRDGGGWTVHQFTAHYTLDTEEGEERDEADEHLVMNFDPRDNPEFTAVSQATLEDSFVTSTDGGNNRSVAPRTDRSEEGGSS